MQPEINIGTLGHVDNGKSTIVQSLTGVWTSRHSEELRRGITIRIGYADASFYECPTCEPPASYSTSKTCPNGHGPTKFLRTVSFVDCPGHHSLMVTMLSGAAIMDGSMFVVSANVKTPQAQDREHMLAAQMIGLRNMIVVQNKRGDEIEIRPGIKTESTNKTVYEPLIAKVGALQAGGGEVKTATPGGLVAVGTDLDPSVTKSDGLVGNVLGRAGTLPPILEKVSLGVDLFEKAVGTEQLMPV